MKARLALLMCILALTAWAADVTGKWTAEMAGRNGNTRQMTINLKADGDKLTGTIGGPRGDTEITDGKVDGDQVSFSVAREFQGQSMKLNYKGQLSGDEIHFTVQREGGEGEGRQFTAKRAAAE